MFCQNCGHQMDDKMKFCENCGTPVSSPNTNKKKEVPKEYAQPVPPTVIPVRPVRSAPSVPSPSAQSPASAPPPPPAFSAPQLNGKATPVSPQPPLKKAPPKKDNKSSQSNNLGLKITALVLVFAVLAGFGFFFADFLMYKREIENGKYITEFPTLKQQTEFMVYDAEKFPAEEYEIKVERYLMGGILKSKAFRNMETVLHDTSTNPVYNIDFEKDGNYRITLKDITASRLQSTTTTAQSSADSSIVEVIIIIEVVVDDNDPDAKDEVSLDFEPITTTTTTTTTVPSTDETSSTELSTEPTSEPSSKEEMTSTESTTAETDRIIAGKVLASDRSTAVSGATLKFYKGSTLFTTASSDISGKYTATLPVGKYHVTITVAGYKPAEFDLDLTGTSNITKQVYLEPVASGTLSGKICKASDRSTPISGATVEVYKGSSLQTKVSSNSSGNYSVNLPAGDYTVKITSSGYIAFTSYAKVTLNQTTYMETFLLIQGSTSESGTATGRVYNSLTGEGLAGVTLTVKKNWNNTSGSGSTVKTATTDANGNYSLTLPLGNYTVIATKSGYTSSSFNIIVQKTTTSNQNGTITPVISGNDYLITLTWGQNPSDLDSHLKGPDYHVYYGNDNGYENGNEVCNLDYDDTSSYGPEHITLTTTSDEPYYYFVHKYSGSGTLASSGAKVTVEQGNRVIAEFNVPTDLGDGIYWNVFAIKDGELIIKDSITSSADVSYAG